MFHAEFKGLADLIGEALAVANIILAAYIVYLQILKLQRGKQGPGRSPWRWLTFLHLGVAVYWVGIYIIIVIKGGNYDPLFSQVFLRPAFTFTLALMVASTLAARG